MDVRQEYSALWHLACAVWGQAVVDSPASHRFVMLTALPKPTGLTAYFDDTGKEVDSVTVSLCGFVASVEQWLLFERDWKTILAMPQFGLTYFHMKELRKAKAGSAWEKFRNNPTLRDDLCDRLYRIIRVRTEQSFAGSVVMSDYNAMNQEYQIRETLGPPHVIASALAIQKTIRWEEQ